MGPAQRPQQLSINIDKVRALYAVKICTETPNDAGVGGGNNHGELVGTCARGHVHAWARTCMGACVRTQARACVRRRVCVWLEVCGRAALQPQHNLRRKLIESGLLFLVACACA